MTRNDPYLSITDFYKVITNSLRNKFNDIGTLNWAVQKYYLKMTLFDLQSGGSRWPYLTSKQRKNSISPRPVPMNIKSNCESSSREMSPRGKTQRPRTIIKRSNWWKVIIQSTSSSLYTIELSPQFATLSLVRFWLAVTIDSTVIVDWLNLVELGYRKIKSLTLSGLHSLLWLANPVSANHWWAIKSTSDGIIESK